MWKDYDLNNPATWRVMEAPTVDPSWEQELTRIGGKNPLGKPNLVWRWGATYRDPMSVDNGLKYWLANTESTLQGFGFVDPVTGLDMLVKTVAEVPGSVLAIPKYSEPQELGERRIIIEQWRSPEFLARSGRYRQTMLHDFGKAYEQFCCRGCDQPLMLADDGPKQCLNCGSKRHYVKTHREEGEGELLRSFPREGAYDFFLRLENALNEPMDADGHALRQIEEAWHYQKDSAKAAERAQLAMAATAQQRAGRELATNPHNPFQAPAFAGE